MPWFARESDARGRADRIDGIARFACGQSCRCHRPQLGGNPLAVVLDAEGLSDARMQAITREFGYPESTFVLPPSGVANTARLVSVAWKKHGAAVCGVRKIRKPARGEC
ncbi:MAG: PhzF family phenazine biosynthesis protein [Xanthomonadales bacterium]|nr:PhzF family phenazine biosynthesis protein [Xanthomonadales bacterium]MBK7145206.1 PhzF family phenazine biosynthesis protein [Xanthomonadales bacterium]MCC6560711.1 PhzF family phenazine biosynthesis protein [Xanthomonadales bacterium]